MIHKDEIKFLKKLAQDYLLSMGMTRSMYYLHHFIFTYLKVFFICLFLQCIIFSGMDQRHWMLDHIRVFVQFSELQFSEFLSKEKWIPENRNHAILDLLAIANVVGGHVTDGGSNSQETRNIHFRYFH